ncbi:MAG: hypothetical protein JHC78_11275 [Ilumatobacteraceae bacterium]|nr:hypothetical protein [Ilumatobacteraceae bacterium]MBJ7368381.1 hypothetical protein [Ilumatobacteraceae bacterium]
MNDDELDPLVLAALGDVVPASDSLREQHIAAALAEISPAEARSRFTRLSAAAAVVVLLVGATAIVRLGATSTDSNVTPRNDTIATVPVKGSACGADLADYTIVGTYSSAGSVREVWSSKQDLVVVDQTSCAQLGTITHPDAAANEKTCDGFFSTTDTQWVGAYSVAGTTLTLIATTNELQIRDGSCAVIASYPLPAQP